MKSIRDILVEFKGRLAKLYGDRLKQVVLYGSWARNEGTQDSDIDVVVVLSGQVKPGEEIDRTIDVITDMTLEYGVLISVYPVSERDYAAVNSPLLMNARKEGITV